MGHAHEEEDKTDADIMGKEVSGKPQWTGLRE